MIKNSITRILSKDDYIKELDNKLIEKCRECVNANNKCDKINEIVDILRVIKCIIDVNGECEEKY